MNRSKFALAAALAVSFALLVPGAASAWAPAATASVHPGVQTYTAGAQCTSNFVFEDGSSVYLGQAAHCSGTGGQTETDGCSSGSLPLGTGVEVKGASKPGTLVYNSWLTMQAKGETDPDTCAYNDLALIRLDPADAGRVNPSLPGFGGPTGVGAAGGLGSTVYSYGNSELRGGITNLSPKQGIVIQDEGGGWSHVVVNADPGDPGRFGQRLRQRLGRGDRRPQHPAAGAAARRQRGRRPGQRARLPAREQLLRRRPARAGDGAVQARPRRSRPRLLARPSSARRPSRSSGCTYISIFWPGWGWGHSSWGGPSRARRRCRRGRRGRSPR